MLFIKKEGKYIDFFENKQHYAFSKRGKLYQHEDVTTELKSYVDSCQLIKQQPQFRKLLENISFNSDNTLLKMKSASSFILSGSEYDIKIHGYDSGTKLYNCIFNKKRSFWNKDQILARLNGFYLIKYLNEPYHLNHIKKYLGSFVGKSWIIFKYFEEAKKEKFTGMCYFCGNHQHISMHDLKERKHIPDCVCITRFTANNNQSRFMTDFSFLTNNVAHQTEKGELIIQEVKEKRHSNIFSDKYYCRLNGNAVSLTVLSIMQLLNYHTTQVEYVLTQKHYGKLSAIACIGYHSNCYNNPIFECKCECGELTKNTYNDLVKHNITCCATCKMNSYHDKELSNKIEYFNDKHIRKVI